jgi:hypothetical protein
MMKAIAAALLAAATLYGAECTVEKTSDVGVSWTAYKTPAKAGVNGGFKAVAYKGKAEAKNLEELLVGSKVYLQTNNVDSNNPGRDAKLVQFFFNQMDGQTIDAEVISLHGDAASGTLTVAVTMNGTAQNVPMQYDVEGDKFSANGYIDLGDFKALSALSSINKACYDLHDGKTWQDVAVAFSFDLKRTCK